MERRIWFWLVFALGAIGAIAALQAIRSATVAEDHRRRVSEIATQTVSRAEVAVDLAVIHLGELIADGQAACGPQAESAIRRAVFAVGSLKDIHIATPVARCSGFPDAGLAMAAALRDGERHPARRRALALASVEAESWSGLGVIWTAGDAELTALMSPGAFLFDMLPGPLRDHATIALEIAPGVPVAAFTGERMRDANVPHGPVAAFSARSERYPLAVEIRVEEAALRAAGAATSPLLQAAAFAFAGLFGLLLARAVVPRPQPADALDEAFARGEIVAFAQPIVSLASGRVVGCEILARWAKPDGSMVPPTAFIPLIEASGRSDRLLETLLAQVGAGLSPLLAARPDLKVAVNVTPDQFLADDFAARLGALAQAAGMAPDSLVVEITERRELASLEAARAVVAALEALGVRVAIDDAGTGHNGLAAIKDLGAATLKIDKLFVDRVDTDQRSRALAEMLVQVARELDMGVVAEGVERPEQAAALLAIGVREAQGYLFGRPTPLAAFAEAATEAQEACDATMPRAVSLDRDRRPARSAAFGR